jgi:hypothetical protein
MNKEERLRFERTGWEPYLKYDFHPSGEFVVEAGRPDYSWVHKTWKDGKRRKLEQQLGEIVGGLEVLAETFRLDRIRRAEEERLRAEEARRREEERRRQEEESKRVERLRRDAALWREANLVREYLSALDAALPNEERTPEFERWLSWAHDKAQQLDPMTRASRA